MGKQFTVIARPAQTGKTTELIQLAAKSFGTIVVQNQSDAQRVRDMAKCMGLDIPFPITYYEFIHGRYFSAGIKEFLIDNVDNLVCSIASEGGVRISAITITTTSPNPDETQSDDSRNKGEFPHYKPFNSLSERKRFRW